MESTKSWIKAKSSRMALITKGVWVSTQKRRHSIWVLEAQQYFERILQVEETEWTEAVQRGKDRYGKQLGSVGLWRQLSWVVEGNWGRLWTPRKTNLDFLGLSSISDPLSKAKPLPWASRMNWSRGESWNVYLCICIFFLLVEKGITYANRQLAGHCMKQVLIPE